VTYLGIIRLTARLSSPQFSITGAPEPWMAEAWPCPDAGGGGPAMDGFESHEQTGWTAPRSSTTGRPYYR
jgi:hypothetical protein